MVEDILGPHYLAEMKADKLSYSGNFQLLTYKYIPGVLKVHTLNDFKPVAEVLDKLHVANYVNPDVRLPNIVFTSNGDAELIDFDLTGLVNTPYPCGYNVPFEEHHPEVKDFSDVS